jgi:hypothetical protein
MVSLSIFLLKAIWQSTLGGEYEPYESGTRFVPCFFHYLQILVSDDSVVTIFVSDLSI